MITLDCRGLACPQPVLQTKDALEQGALEIEVLVDNEASKNNIERFGRSRGCRLNSTELEEECYRIHLLSEGEAASPAFKAEDYSCTPSAVNKLVYVISSDSMGRGSDELGWALLQTYIQTIKEVEPLPSTILFYNGGVRLVAEESGALEALSQLQAQGVEILACGTCLDFFSLKSALKVGQISNMYDIMSAMTEADKVVSPF